MKCPGCQREISDDLKHCPQCGADLSKTKTRAPSTAKTSQEEKDKGELKAKSASPRKAAPIFLPVLVLCLTLFIGLVMFERHRAKMHVQNPMPLNPYYITFDETHF